MYEKNIASTIIKEIKVADKKIEAHNYGTCNIHPATVPENPIQSTFTASYPGSGAKMTWKLIEAMTGLGRWHYITLL
jgi:hypothetical protein